jgi:chloramphenicol-sensitive protein RarD
MEKPSLRKGVLFAVSAYVFWGLFPVYWKLLSEIPSLHILSFRIILSMLLLAVILFINKKTSWLRFYKDRRKTLLLTLSALAITANWGMYIWAVNSGRTIEAALGYYINPLVSIVLGLCFFREKLKPLQILAFALAFMGVATLTVLTGKLPWVSLGLALTFGFYGLLKKAVNLSSMESLGTETMIASPLGLLLLLTAFDVNSGLVFPNIQGLSYFTALPFYTLILLSFCGFVTSFPLYLFSEGAKRLPLSTLGFIQFISPTMGFLTGLFIFGESFPPRNFIAFGFIWAAVIVYIISINAGKTRP